MYTIQQLQAADFLLKKLLLDDTMPIYDKNLKFVINLNNNYWYGDFVPFKDRSPAQLFICDDGDVELDYFSATGSNAIKVFKKIWDTYMTQISVGGFLTNPFTKIHTYDLLFNTILKLVDFSEIEIDDSPMYPYLLNAQSIDSKLTLPFINIGNEEVKLVSLIEVTE